MQIETFRFWDEYDNEYQTFSIVSSARAWTSVILAGKCGSRRHSTTSFSENVEVAETSYQMLRSLIILRTGVGVTSFTKGKSYNSSSEKGKMKLSGKSIRWEYAKKLEVKSRTRSRPHPRI